MKVLIPTGAFPPEVGGPATYVPRIATALAERGHQVEVVTLSPGRGHLDHRYPFRVHSLARSGRKTWRWVKVLGRLVSLLWESDLVFVNGLLIETALANLITRRPAVAKVVGDIVWERARDKGWITDEFEEFQRHRYGWRIELRRTLRNWALQQMQAVITPSIYLRKITAGWGVDSLCIRVIYNAYEPISTDSPPALLPLTTRYRLITVCRLVGWKGVDGLIEVVAHLPDVGLVVVGDGPERANLEALTHQLDVNDRVHFAGQVPGERIPAYLRACDLFVLNSRYEGLPHAVLEALAAGKPVVATAVGGTPEVIQDGTNGRLVPAGDVKALQEAIREALGGVSPIQSAFEVSDKFTYQRMFEDTLALLEKNSNKSLLRYC